MLEFPGVRIPALDDQPAFTMGAIFLDMSPFFYDLDTFGEIGGRERLEIDYDYFGFGWWKPETKGDQHGT